MRSAATSSFVWIRSHLVVTVLFLGYLVMSMLIYEQGRVIDSQKALIHDLFGDSVELSSKKIHELREFERQH